MRGIWETLSGTLPVAEVFWHLFWQLWFRRGSLWSGALWRHLRWRLLENAVGNTSWTPGSLGNSTVHLKKAEHAIQGIKTCSKDTSQRLPKWRAWLPQDTSGLQSPREIASTEDWGVLDPVVHTFASELSTHLGSHTDEIALTLGGWSWGRDLWRVIHGRLDGFIWLYKLGMRHFI